MKLLSTRTIISVLLAVIALLIFVNYQALSNFFTIEQLKKNNECLAVYVHDHYVFSVLLYIIFFYRYCGVWSAAYISVVIDRRFSIRADSRAYFCDTQLCFGFIVLLFSIAVCDGGLGKKLAQ